MLELWILNSIVLLVVILLGILVYQSYKRIHVLEEKVKKFSTEHDMDHQLMDIFSGHIDTARIQFLAGRVFHFAKKKYELHSNSYSEILEELHKNDTIEKNIREYLINFFDEVITLLYKNTKNITEEDKNNLREKVRLLASIMEKE